MFMELLRTTEAEAGVPAGACVIMAGLVLWARWPTHRERLLIVGAAALLTALVGAAYVVALRVGWWTGAYFSLPVLTQAGILLSLGLLGGTLWLAGYSWLGDHTRQPVQIYIAVSLLLLLAVALANRLNIGQGAILVGPGATIVVEAAIGQGILWLPVLVYEALRRNVERFDPLP
jgi:hypothetical protein